MDFTAFVLSQLPGPPARVLEVGCGRRGGVAPALAEAGYDVAAIDPDAPEGPLYRRITLEELAEDETFDAAICGRVLHHVHPLGEALDKLARLAPLLVLDEFAWNRIDDPTREWYEGQHRMLVAAGHDPPGPPDLGEWRERHAGLHPFEDLRREVEARYEERVFEWRPYLHRWLGTEASRALEQTLIEADAVRAVGWVYAGLRSETVRSARTAR